VSVCGLRGDLDADVLVGLVEQVEMMRLVWSLGTYMQTLNRFHISGVRSLFYRVKSNQCCYKPRFSRKRGSILSFWLETQAPAYKKNSTQICLLVKAVVCQEKPVQIAEYGRSRKVFGDILGFKLYWTYQGWQRNYVK